MYFINPSWLALPLTDQWASYVSLFDWKPSFCQDSTLSLPPFLKAFGSLWLPPYGTVVLLSSINAAEYFTYCAGKSALMVSAATLSSTTFMLKLSQFTGRATYYKLCYIRWLNTISIIWMFSVFYCLKCSLRSLLSCTPSTQPTCIKTPGSTKMHPALMSKKKLNAYTTNKTCRRQKMCLQLNILKTCSCLKRLRDWHMKGQSSGHKDER